ncbi:hypothetical protein A2U01_0029635, partial [Trifolium medium]|nr:hypothetical protein [Trifolium medium]
MEVGENSGVDVDAVVINKIAVVVGFGGGRCRLRYQMWWWDDDG